MERTAGLVRTEMHKFQTKLTKMANVLKTVGLHNKQCSDGEWPCNTREEIIGRLEYT